MHARNPAKDEYKEDVMKTMFRMITLGVLAMALPMAASASDQSTSEGTKLGKLECQTVDGYGTNLLIPSTVDVKCTFSSTAGDVEN